MAQQTSYQQNPAIGRPGQQAEMRENVDIVSRIAQGSAVIPGQLVSQGTGVRSNPSTTQLASPNGSSPGTVIGFPGHSVFTDDPILANEWVGVAMYQDSLEPQVSGAYSAGDPVPVMKRGPVIVAVAEAVAQGGLVYVWSNPSGGDPAIGTFAAGSHSGKAVAFPSGTWGSSTSGAGVAILELKS